MKRITTLAVAALATGAVAASPAYGDDHARDAHERAAAAQTGGPIEDAFPYRETPDRVDRFGDAPGTSARYAPAPDVQPVWPVDTSPPPKSASVVPAGDGSGDESAWLVVGGLAAAGIVGAGAAGITRRHRARRVAV